MTPGTRTIRTSVASMSTATARPRPICFTETFAPATKDRNTTIMIAAAAVITRAVRASPCATEAALSPVASYASRIRESRNTS
jgi:hypothetical protein